MRIASRGPALLAACAALAILAAPASAAPGDLDGGFAGGGLFTGSFMTTFPGAEDSHKVAIDSQGRVIVAATLEGQLNGGLPRAIRVLRLTPQGTPDGSFGSGGAVTLPLVGDTRLGGLVIDSQDRPVIAGTNLEIPNSQIALMRLTAGGQPDTSFSGDGQLIAGWTGSGLAPQAAGLAIDAAGGLLVAGIAYSPGPGSTRAFFVTRFTADGDPDAAYGVAGWRQVGTSAPGFRELAAITALPAGGAMVSGFDNSLFVARLTAGGALDNQFDGDGIATTELGKGAGDGVTSYGMTVDPDGRAIVVGQLTTSLNARWTIARMTSSGAMDPSFGTGTPTAGAVLGPLSTGRANDVELQCDGKLLVTGIASRSDLSGNTLPLARYTAAGALDTSFAPTATTPGIATVDAGFNDIGSDIALSPGAATVIGFRRANIEGEGFSDRPIVARFLTDDSCAGAPPATIPTVPITPPVAGASTPPPAAKAVLPKFASLVALPSAKQCVSRRRFSIRLRVPKGSTVTSAEVKVNKKRVTVRRGARLRSVVNLTQLPKGSFRVDIVMKLADGRTVKGTRTYRTCAVKKQRAGKSPRV